MPIYEFQRPKGLGHGTISFQGENVREAAAKYETWKENRMKKRDIMVQHGYSQEQMQRHQAFLNREYAREREIQRGTYGKVQRRNPQTGQWE